MRDRKKARERAEALVSQMTVDEMASQLKFLHITGGMKDFTE